MAEQEAVAKDEQFILISMLPDVCLTPSKNGVPVPYQHPSEVKKWMRSQGMYVIGD